MTDEWELNVIEETIFCAEGAIPITWDRHRDTNLWAIRSPAHRGLMIVGNGNERMSMRDRVAPTIAALIEAESTASAAEEKKG